MKTTQGDLGLETPQEFSNRLGLSFQDLSLLTRALTHRSYRNENNDALEDNERLEFLGDAVLDFIVATWIYHHFPEMSEGQLTRMRSALVNKDQLAEFGLQIGIDKAVMLGRGEEDGGGRTREAMLCAAFEALIGALSLDKGVEAVEVFVAPLLDTATDQIISEHSDKDAKSQLQEWAQSNKMPTPSYLTAAEHGPDHDKIFEVNVVIEGDVYGSGHGRSKQEAGKVAAKDALQKLNLI